MFAKKNALLNKVCAVSFFCFFKPICAKWVAVSARLGWGILPGGVLVGARGGVFLWFGFVVVGVVRRAACSGRHAGGPPGFRTCTVALPFCHFSLKSKKPSSSQYPRVLLTIGDHLLKKRLDLKDRVGLKGAYRQPDL